MKKSIVIAFAALVGIVSLSSCGGGWTEENKASMKETCAGLMKLSYDEADATAICDCYITSLVEKFPKADFNPEQNQAEMDGCAANYKTTAEKEAEAAAAAEAEAAAAAAAATEGAEAAAPAAN
jgi:hypothetical protein